VPFLIICLLSPRGPMVWSATVRASERASWENAYGSSCRSSCKLWRRSGLRSGGRLGCRLPGASRCSAGGERRQLGGSRYRAVRARSRCRVATQRRLTAVQILGQPRGPAIRRVERLLGCAQVVRIRVKDVPGQVGRTGHHLRRLKPFVDLAGLLRLQVVRHVTTSSSNRSWLTPPQ
jgi:hypothetical protein